ncbi:MAG: hypothetical protein Q8L44_04560 [Sulfuritalea sp.]|nr:hypothetical protein [Sulfuritalea sp.]
MAASLSDSGTATVRAILGPVREQLVEAALGLASYQNAYGRLSGWQAFALTLCFGMGEVLDTAMETGDIDGRRDLANLVRLADDAMFAARWPADEWWAYVARTQGNRDTLALVRHVEDQIAAGGLGQLAIYGQFSDAVKAGHRLMDQQYLERHTPECNECGKAGSI